MAKYVVEIRRIGEGNVTEAGLFTFERYLFNEPGHLRSQPCADGYCFHLLSSRNRIEARLNLFVRDATGLSPCRAPFGGLEFNPRLDVRHLDALLEAIEAFARTQGLHQLRMTSYPFSYAPEAAQTISQRLLNRGYTLDKSELSYHLPIQAGPFESLLTGPEKRRLNKCRRAGFQWSEETHPELESVYQFVKSGRERRGFPTSLPLAEFQDLFRRFPDTYTVFTLRDGNTVVALTVTVRINDRILYNFYPADTDAYLSYSPTVRLTEGLYDYCRKKGYSLLDLGLSTDRGAPNYGLIRFKKNLGAQASLKLSFEKTFPPHSAG